LMNVKSCEIGKGNSEYCENNLQPQHAW
jgi:hypothetical protein